MPDEEMDDEAPDDDDFEPADVDKPVPTDEKSRRLAREAAEEDETRREILLGRIAKARRLLYAAEDRGDTDDAAQLRAKIASLSAERDTL